MFSDVVEYFGLGYRGVRRVPVKITSTSAGDRYLSVEYAYLTNKISQVNGKRVAIKLSSNGIDNAQPIENDVLYYLKQPGKPAGDLPIESFKYGNLRADCSSSVNMCEHSVGVDSPAVTGTNNNMRMYVIYWTQDGIPFICDFLSQSETNTNIVDIYFHTVPRIDCRLMRSFTSQKPNYSEYVSFSRKINKGEIIYYKQHTTVGYPGEGAVGYKTTVTYKFYQCTKEGIPVGALTGGESLNTVVPDGTCSLVKIDGDYSDEYHKISVDVSSVPKYLEHGQTVPTVMATQISDVRVDGSKFITTLVGEGFTGTIGVGVLGYASAPPPPRNYESNDNYQIIEWSVNYSGGFFQITYNVIMDEFTRVNCTIEEPTVPKVIGQSVWAEQYTDLGGVGSEESRQDFEGGFTTTIAVKSIPPGESINPSLNIRIPDYTTHVDKIIYSCYDEDGDRKDVRYIGDSTYSGTYNKIYTGRVSGPSSMTCIGSPGSYVCSEPLGSVVSDTTEDINITLEYHAVLMFGDRVIYDVRRTRTTVGSGFLEANSGSGITSTATLTDTTTVDGGYTNTETYGPAPIETLRDAVFDWNNLLSFISIVGWKLIYATFDNMTKYPIILNNKFVGSVFRANPSSPIKLSDINSPSASYSSMSTTVPMSPVFIDVSLYDPITDTELDGVAELTCFNHTSSFDSTNPQNPKYIWKDLWGNDPPEWCGFSPYF